MGAIESVEFILKGVGKTARFVNQLGKPTPIAIGIVRGCELVRELSEGFGIGVDFGVGPQSGICGADIETSDVGGKLIGTGGSQRNAVASRSVGQARGRNRQRRE